MPKFYTRFRRDIKSPSKFYAKFHYFAKIPMPKSCAKFHDLSKIRVKFNGAILRRSVNLRQIWRDFSAFAWMSLNFATPCANRTSRLFAPLASLRLAPVKTSKFFHSTLEFLRFAASRLDRFVSCSRACRLVSSYLDRARSYRIRGGFLYKFCFF